MGRLKLSKRALRIEPSITLELDARAKALRAEGVDVVNMSVGEPDFPAPAVVQDAAVEKVRSGDVKYTPAAGTPAARAAVAAYLKATRGLEWSDREIGLCHSTKHALTGVLLALVDEGDEVLVPLPAWASYFEEIRICGAEPVLVPPRPGTVAPDLEALERALTPRSKVLMINSPNNPSGYVFTEDETRALAEFAVRHDLWLLSDEIYRSLVYEGPEAVSPATFSAEARARTLIVDGASKAFAMTGYRIGFVAGPAEVVRAVADLQSQMTGSPNAVSQHAYAAALTGDVPEAAAMKAEFQRRRDVLLAGLAELGLETPAPRGAFYAFPDVSPWLDEGGSVAFCQALLEEEKVALVPGQAFGLDHHVRLSYACSVETIREALTRLGRFLAKRPARVQATPGS